MIVACQGFAACSVESSPCHLMLSFCKVLPISLRRSPQSNCPASSRSRHAFTTCPCHRKICNYTVTWASVSVSDSPSKRLCPPEAKAAGRQGDDMWDNVSDQTVLFNLAARLCQLIYAFASSPLCSQVGPDALQSFQSFFSSHMLALSQLGPAK